MPKYQWRSISSFYINSLHYTTIALVPMFERPKFECYPTARSCFGIQTLAAKAAAVGRRDKSFFRLPLRHPLRRIIRSLNIFLFSNKWFIISVLMNKEVFKYFISKWNLCGTSKIMFIGLLNWYCEKIKLFPTKNYL